MKKLKKVNGQLLGSPDFRKVLTREERRKILGGAYDSMTETLTSNHDCYPCGIDKDSNDPSIPYYCIVC